MYKDIISRERFNNLIKFIPLIVILAGFSAISILGYPLIAILSCFAVLITQFGLAIMGENKLSETLKQYKITYNDYKEFKKSGGIKRIKTIIKEYQKLKNKYGFSFENENPLADVILNYENPKLLEKDKNSINSFPEFSRNNIVKINNEYTHISNDNDTFQL